MVTILDLARHKNPQLGDSISMGDLDDLDLPFFGGCEVCQASLACYNMYPSKSGYVRCSSCICEDGWTDVATADKEIFG